MATRKETRGDGITEYKVVVPKRLADGSLDPEGVEDVFARSNVGMTFGGWIETHEVQAKLILEAAGLPSIFGRFVFRPGREWRFYDRTTDSGVPEGQEVGKLRALVGAWGFDEQSKQGYAARIIEWAYYTRTMIGAGKADQAAGFAAQTAKFVTEARIKFEWENDALRARRARVNFEAGTRRSNQERHDEAKGRHQYCQEKANEIWQAHPNWTKIRVASLIVKEWAKEREDPVPTISTVRNKIIKPEICSG